MVPLDGASSIASRDDVGNERHDTEVRVECLEGVYCLLISHASKLEDGNAVSLAATFKGSWGRPSRSGGQKAATTFSPRSTRAFSTLSPKDAWPMMAIRKSAAMVSSSNALARSSPDRSAKNRYGPTASPSKRRRKYSISYPASQRRTRISRILLANALTLDF